MWSLVLSAFAFFGVTAFGIEPAEIVSLLIDRNVSSNLKIAAAEQGIFHAKAHLCLGAASPLEKPLQADKLPNVVLITKEGNDLGPHGSLKAVDTALLKLERVAALTALERINSWFSSANPREGLPTLAEKGCLAAAAIFGARTIENGKLGDFAIDFAARKLVAEKIVALLNREELRETKVSVSDLVESRLGIPLKEID